MQDRPTLSLEESNEDFPIPTDGRAFLVGRGADTDCQVKSLHCSRRQFQLRIDGEGAWLEPLSASVPTTLNGDPVKFPVLLKDRDRIAVGKTRFRFLEPEQPAAIGTIAFEARDQAFVPGEIALERDALIGRDSACTVVLDHPGVSRRHAEVRVGADRAELRDLRSTNGTFLNGERVFGFRELRPGDRVDVGPYALEFTGTGLVQTTREGNLRIVGSGLSRTVPDRAGKGRRPILSDVSLVVEPRELICLLGPSGSGKTTLMNALSARVPAEAGEVRVNGVDLYGSFEALKQGIALVPQHDVLHEDLVLERAVTFTARLRLPADMGEAGVRAEVQRVLASVDLGEHVETRIRGLSGGQKKRASLANETVSRPDLLFLDEVTSGLDEQTDLEMMRLFRRRAEEGMTVVCVTHTLANVEECCHKVAILAPGGFLAFLGTPREACAYFGIDRLAAVYAVLAGRPGEEWARLYRESEPHRRHLAPHLETGTDLRAAASAPAAPAPGGSRAQVQHARQLAILTRRYLELVLADRRTLAIAFAQSVLIGAALCLVFGEHADQAFLRRGLLFLLGISSLWFGCNNASREIVKERFIYRRERDVNLSVTSYLASKLGVLCVLGLLQVLLLYTIVGPVLGVPGPDLPQLGVLTLVAVAGTCLGLLISAGATSQDQATALAPVALIPQIIMAGLVVPPDLMPGFTQVLCKVAITGYWVLQGLEGLRSEDGAEALTSTLVLAAHAAVYLLGAWVILALRDSRGGAR